MYRLEPANAVMGRGHRLTNFVRSPWVMGEGDEAQFVEQLASSGAAWTRVTHQVGWFKRFHLLQSTPAEMVLVHNFLLEAHRTLGAAKLVVGVPSRDTIVAADHAGLARLMVITTLRYMEVPEAQKLSADLLVVEDGDVVGMVLNTLLEKEMSAEATLDRALRVGPDGEFHLSAGTEVESLFGLAENVISFVAEKWSSDPTFSGESTVFITAPEAMKPALDELASFISVAATETGIERLRFRVEHVPHV
jgi:hypothetical protein